MSTTDLARPGVGHLYNSWATAQPAGMVSHAEIAHHSRRSNSISSNKRRPLAHHGRHGSSTAALVKDEFPFFAVTGDVEIVISCDGEEKRYLLHRLILAQFSGFFDVGINEDSFKQHMPRDAQPRRDHDHNNLSAINEEVSSSLSAPSVVARESNGRAAPGRRRWRYELNWDTVSADEEPVLVSKVPLGPGYTPNLPTAPPIPRPQPSLASSNFHSTINLSSRPPVQSHSQSAANLALPPSAVTTNPLIRDYDNLFRMFYNYPPALNSINIASAYSECKSLLGLADMYDALSVTGPRVEHHLLAFSSRLFKQIAKYPPSYLKLGYMARSKVIFCEALIHVVGQWPQAYPYLKPSTQYTGYEVPLHVLDLIEDKVDEMEELRLKIEAKLFRLTLTTNRGERVNPSNDYLGWLAMSLYRQWIAESTTPEVRGILKHPSRPPTGNSSQSNMGMPPTQSPPAQPPGLLPVNNGRIFRLIVSPNPESYLGHDELKRFLKIQPTTSSNSVLYSKDNLRRFERRMDQLKNLARDIVKPLTRNCLELDLRLLGNDGGGGLGYLTCAKIDDEDLPWR